MAGYGWLYGSVSLTLTNIWIQVEGRVLGVIIYYFCSVTVLCVWQYIFFVDLFVYLDRFWAGGGVSEMCVEVCRSGGSSRV